MEITLKCTPEELVKLIKTNEDQQLIDLSNLTKRMQESLNQSRSKISRLQRLLNS